MLLCKFIAFCPYTIWLLCKCNYVQNCMVHVQCIYTYLTITLFSTYMVLRATRLTNKNTTKPMPIASWPIVTYKNLQKELVKATLHRQNFPFGQLVKCFKHHTYMDQQNTRSKLQTHTHVHTNTCNHTHTHTHTHTNTCTHTQTHVHTHKHTRSFLSNARN